MLAPASVLEAPAGFSWQSLKGGMGAAGDTVLSLSRAFRASPSRQEPVTLSKWLSPIGLEDLARRLCKTIVFSGMLDVSDNTL